MKPILALSRKYGLRVIEDAAHALPASYEGRRVGALGDLTAFSFYATKNMTTAEGGMLTGDPRLVEKARMLSLHGMSRDAWKRYAAKGAWFYEVLEAGFKYNLPDILSALGIQQLRRLPEFQEKRRRIVAEYQRAFSRMPELQTPVEKKGVEHAWHLYVLRLETERLNIGRDAFLEILRSKGVGASVHFIPIHLHRYYRKKYGFRPLDYPVAFREYRRSVSLPLSPALSAHDRTQVMRVTADIVLRHRKKQ